MNFGKPELLHDYTGHHIWDGTRWREFTPRAGDIVINTSYKAGTTWMQAIVANLLFPDGEFPAPVSVMSPWLEMRLKPIAEVLADLDAQTHRRFVKSHSPLNGLKFFDELRYIVVGRDIRDIFMSLWNHHTNYSDEMKRILSEFDDELGRAFPFEQGDLRTWWRIWTTRPWFDWETEGYPYASPFNHAQSWWDYRHLPNILLVHFAKLLSDPEGEIRRVAEFLQIPINESALPGIIERTSFGYMRENFKDIMPEANVIWRGGGNTFMNKGTNGRWRDVLTEDDLALYAAAVERTLDPACARWLETATV